MKTIKIILPVAITAYTLYQRSGSGGVQNIMMNAETEDIIVSVGLGIIASMILTKVL